MTAKTEKLRVQIFAGDKLIGESESHELWHSVFLFIQEEEKQDDNDDDLIDEDPVDEETMS